MAKKADLLAQAKELGLDVNEKNTIAEIESAINNMPTGSGATNDGTTEEVSKDQDEADSEADQKIAKAGKRSAKAIAEAEAKAEKEARKASREESEAVQETKPAQKPPRSKLERSGKKLREASKLVDKTQEYGLKAALELAKKTATTKFDSTVELHIRLNVDPKHADQNIREMVVLPAGTGKTVKVAVFADVDDVALAKKAGADIAGSDEFLQQLDKGTIDFDVLIATPTMMAKLGKYARLLGPKGLMPNPKSGTVTTDVAKAVTEAKAGKVELRVDETGIIHVGIGKVSFTDEKLLENAQAIFNTVKSAKPSSIKGAFVVSIYATTSMGPSVRIASSEI